MIRSGWALPRSRARFEPDRSRPAGSAHKRRRRSPRFSRRPWGLLSFTSRPTSRDQARAFCLRSVRCDPVGTLDSGGRVACGAPISGSVVRGHVEGSLTRTSRHRGHRPGSRTASFATRSCRRRASNAQTPKMIANANAPKPTRVSGQTLTESSTLPNQRRRRTPCICCPQRGSPMGPSAWGAPLPYGPGHGRSRRGRWRCTAQGRIVAGRPVAVGREKEPRAIRPKIAAITSRAFPRLPHCPSRSPRTRQRRSGASFVAGISVDGVAHRR